MPRVARGHVEQLPSGSFRAVVYAGTDPLTRRPVYLKATARTEKQAQAELGKLLGKASGGRRPESDATVAKLLDEYAQLARWDLSTRETNEGYIRRTIKPALGHIQVRQVRARTLELLYARLRRCHDPSCTGKPFTEHRSVPDLRPVPGDPRPAWQHAADAIRDAITAGMLTPGDPLPSVPELNAQQGVRVSTLQHALKLLAEERLIVLRQGRPAAVAGNASIASGPAWPRGRRPGPGHHCALSGCRPHTCKPMAPRTIRIIHSILSGAFAAAERWEWIDGKNPAEAAGLPAASGKSLPATPPEDVAKVIAACRTSRLDLGLYVWLAAVTGMRRGELCALQIRDVNLDRGLVHIAHNYVVRGGRRVRKDTKTHQDRWLAIDPDTCALIMNHLDEIRTTLAAVGLELPGDAYLFSNDPVHARPWNPDWATHQVADAAAAAGIELDIKGLRHYTASQLLAASFDLRNTAARLGHSGGGATTLKFYADPVAEVDRRAAAYLSELTAGAAAPAQSAGATAPGRGDHRPEAANS